MKFMLFHKLFFRNEAVEFRMTFSPHTYKPTCDLQVTFLSKRFKTRGNFIKKRPILVMQVKNKQQIMLRLIHLLNSSLECTCTYTSTYQYTIMYIFRPCGPISGQKRELIAVSSLYRIFIRFLIFTSYPEHGTHIVVSINLYYKHTIMIIDIESLSCCCYFYFIVQYTHSLVWYVSS